jgi:hypothetical protein
MPDPSMKNKISDIELVEYADKLAQTSNRILRYVKDDGRTDGSFYEDTSSGERQCVPKKFINSIGLEAAFELAALDPNELIPSTK